MTQDERDLLRLDAELDQFGAEIESFAVEDLNRWRRLHTILTGGDNKCTTEEVAELMKLAFYAHQVITGRLLGRDH